jgi:hypothetical protein
MQLPIKKLIIGVIKRDNQILLRKKFANSKPYKETWYLFGCEPELGKEPSQIFIDYAKNNLGINIEFNRILPVNTETKEDHDGITKKFIYIAMEFNYIDGKPLLPESHEKIEFINIDNLKNTDLVPPSKKLFKQIGYIE